MVDYKLVHNVSPAYKRQAVRTQHSCSQREQRSIRVSKRPIQVAIILGLMFAIIFLLVSFYVSSKEKIEFVEVTVQAGDTLWSIARNFHNSSTDIRDLIYYIQQLNRLTSAHIYPGQVILIPLVD